ncbi:Glutathione synthase/Ribosomal protein S6 modification enzyme (glutaminyl transferase) [Bacteroidales bacterium Barb6]|nr:Glutathione synthase/Ribosomal protein S6 modification enzyme (glutaminyl transferase) [Bacteroidales bacterium Barb6]
MKDKTIAGIRRGNKFSPNHVGNDAAIFSLTVQHLQAFGCTVHEYIESDLQMREIPEAAVFGMARSKQAVRRLRQLEQEGRTVVNSAVGIGNCIRGEMTRLLTGNGIPHPESLIFRTGENPVGALEEAGFRNGWVKRGDSHAVHREDVTYVRDPEEAHTILKEFALRNIPDAVINKHLTGDLIKFYGVRDSGFFYWFYPSDIHHSKFGWEQINGTARGIPFDPTALEALCDRAAGVLNVHIYGGDCIVSEDGDIRIIDFNDWPSFAPCRETAAKHIAECIWNVTGFAENR